MADWAATAASWATAIGLAFTALQLGLARRTARGEFEARFIDRYEALLWRLPPEVVLEQAELAEPDLEQLRVFHDYFALCDEEVFYRRKGKISRSTWDDWSRGIQLNLQRDTYYGAWRMLLENGRLDGRFSDMAAAIETLRVGGHHDPRPKWPRRWFIRL